MKSALILLLLFSGLTFGQQITKKPYLSWEGESSTTMTISWETDTPLNSIVQYGKSVPFSHTVQTDSLCTLHHIQLTGLEPNTVYLYHVSSSEGPTSEVYQFRTGSPYLVSYRFGVMGDDRDGDQVHQSIINSIGTFDPDFLINTGDLVGNASNMASWAAFFDIEKNLIGYVPLMPAQGNHDDYGHWYQKFFALPNNVDPAWELFYAYSYGNAYFIVLNSNFSTYWTAPGKSEYNWLEDQLQNQAQNYDWRFVVFHHPPYGSGHHGGWEPGATYWVPLFETYGVDAVFNGHNHFYEHSIKNGIHYFTIGGGGADLHSMSTPDENPYRVKFEEVYHYAIVDVDGPNLSIKVYREDNSLMDAMEKTKDFSLPIFLSEFTANREENHTRIYWQTESEMDLVGFSLERKIGEISDYSLVSSYETDDALRAAGTTNMEKDYEYQDRFYSENQDYRYLLKAHFVDGTVEEFGPVEVQKIDKGGVFASGISISNFPNPFNVSTRIKIYLPNVLSTQNHLTVGIYDVSGRRVKSFMEREPRSGHYEITWNGTDENGELVSSGIYLVRVVWGNTYSVHKITILK